MGRLLCIDYGKRRCGLAVSDPLKTIAFPLETIEERNLFRFIVSYTRQEVVEGIVIGYPYSMDGSPNEMTEAIDKIIEKLKSSFGNLDIQKHDERFTSKMASGIINTLNLPRNRKHKKEEIDRTSATLILQSYLEKLEFDKSRL